MEGNKTGLRRVLAILLCVILVTGNLGSTALAEDFMSGSDELLFYTDEETNSDEETITDEETIMDEEDSTEEVFFSDTEESAGLTENAQSEEMQDDVDGLVTEDITSVDEEFYDEILAAEGEQAEDYVSVVSDPFIAVDEPQTFTMAQEEAAEAEPVAFEQSRTVDAVIITVKADPGIFPADAVLSVEQVPVYQQAQKDAAVEELRDENQNVAVSYTIDIKVIIPLQKPPSQREVDRAAGRRE